jgi:hypothetical protein
MTSLSQSISSFKVEELLKGRGRLIRRQADFSMNPRNLRRSSSTELENIADVTHLQEVGSTTEAEE